MNTSDHVIRRRSLRSVICRFQIALNDNTLKLEIADNSRLPFLCIFYDFHIHYINNIGCVAREQGSAHYYCQTIQEQLNGMEGGGVRVEEIILMVPVNAQYTLCIFSQNYSANITKKTWP